MKLSSMSILLIAILSIGAVVEEDAPPARRLELYQVLGRVNVSPIPEDEDSLYLDNIIFKTGPVIRNDSMLAKYLTAVVEVTSMIKSDQTVSGCQLVVRENRIPVWATRCAKGVTTGGQHTCVVRSTHQGDVELLTDITDFGGVERLWHAGTSNMNSAWIGLSSDGLFVADSANITLWRSPLSPTPPTVCSELLLDEILLHPPDKGFDSGSQVVMPAGLSMSLFLILMYTFYMV